MAKRIAGRGSPGRKARGGRSSRRPGKKPADPTKALLRRFLAARSSVTGALMEIDQGVCLSAGGLIFAANAAAARVLGAERPEALVGRSFDEFLDEEGREVFASRSRMITGLGVSPGRITYAGRRLDGSAAFVEVAAAPVRMGAQTAVLTLLRDVTESSRVQRAARLGAWEADHRTGAVTMSEGVREIVELGVEGADVAYDALISRIHPDDRPLVESAWARSIGAQLPFEMTYRLVMPDGRVKHVVAQARASLGADGRPWYAAGTLHDVTDQVELEQRLLFASRAVEASPTATAFTDVAGRLTLVNPAFLRLWGLTDAREVLGRQPYEIMGDPDAARERVRRCAVEGSLVEETRLRRSDGTTFPAQIAAARVADRDGRSLGLMAQFIDHTEREEARAALEKSERELQEAARLDALGRLAAGIAHDFNNVLAVVLGLGAVLERTLEAASPARPLARDITEAAERAADLTRQLLTFARARKGEISDVDVAARIEVVGRLAARTLGEQIELVTEVEDGIGAIRIGAGDLDRVLMNLAINARDAMPDGGRLLIRARAVSEAPPPVGAKECVYVEVRDEGAGITKEVLPRIFEPFFTTKVGGLGAGLGLPTVYGIVRRAGGVIRVDSTPGKGTAFHLFFPRGEPQGAGQPAAEGGTMRGRETILLVEDERAALRVVAHMLEEGGYRVLAATNAREALEIHREVRGIDLLVSDVVMPGMSGPSLYHELQRQRPGLPAVFISGYAPDVESLEQLGRFVQKPFREETLLRAVRHVLDERVSGAA
jgi:PAS domain S-box-containing protein